MGLILSTQFHKGSLIEEVSGKPFTVEATGVFNRLNNRLAFCNSRFNLSNELSMKNKTFVMAWDIDGRKGTGAVSSIFRGSDGLNTIDFAGGAAQNWFQYYYIDDVLGTPVYSTSSFTAPRKNVPLLYIVTAGNNWWKLYVNGVLSASYTGVEIRDKKVTYYLGAHNNGGILYGQKAIYYTKIYDNVLTPDQISAEYQYFLNLKSPQKKVYLPYTYKTPRNSDTVGLVANYTKTNGQKLVDNLGTYNVTPTAGFVEKNKDYPFSFKDYRGTPTSTIVLNKTYSYFFRICINGASETIFSTATEYFILETGGYLFKCLFGFGLYTLSMPSTFTYGKEYTCCLIRNGVTIKFYVNGVLNRTEILADVQNPNWNITKIGNPTGTAGIKSKFKDISIYNIVKTEADVIAYHNRFASVPHITLYEDFSNYAVGQTYGEPYLTNARPVIAELASAAYGYPKGKKYLASSTTNKITYLKQKSAYGKWTIKLRVNLISGNFYIPFICNRRNESNPWVIYGYLIAIAFDKSIILQRDGFALSTVYNAYTPNQIFTIEIERTISNLFTVKINDKQIISVTDATYTTSECMRLDTLYTDYYEIKHTSL